MTTAELWKGRASGSPLVLPADIDMDGPWSRASTLGLLDDWVVAGLLDRRHFLAVSGTTILDIATKYQTGAPGRLAAALERGSVGNPLLAQIEQSIPLLQRLDDTHGGGAYLPYVGAQFRAVALLLGQGWPSRWGGAALHSCAAASSCSAPAHTLCQWITPPSAALCSREPGCPSPPPGRAIWSRPARSAVSRSRA